VPGVSVELWGAGPNGIEENGAGDDALVGTPVVTDLNGNYLFTGLTPGNNFYVRIPVPPTLYPRSSGVPVSLDNGLDNDNNGLQPGGAGTAVRSPKFNLAANGEAPTGVDGDDTNGELTIDFGFANPDLSYANNLIDNASFEFDGTPNTNWGAGGRAWLHRHGHDLRRWQECPALGGRHQRHQPAGITHRAHASAGGGRWGEGGLGGEH